MILIKGQSNCAKVERLVNEINDEVATWMESLEDSGFEFSFTYLGLKGDSNAYGKYLSRIVDEFLDEIPKVH
jgi:hypothetical protein